MATSHVPHCCANILCETMVTDPSQQYCEECRSNKIENIPFKPMPLNTEEQMMDVVLQNEKALADLCGVRTVQLGTAADPVVEANRRLLLERSNVGISKYGVTLADSGLTRRQYLQHALEEALDLANYLQAEIQRMDKEAAFYESCKAS